jgi:putative aldouronate transport system substrate-binding protein
MKRFVSALLIAGMLFTMCTACGTTTTSTAEKEASATASVTEETTAAAPETAPASEQDTPEASVASAEESAEAEEAVTYVSPFPLEEPATLTAWAMWIPGIEQYVSSPGETAVFQEMQKMTNVTLEMSLASSPETAMTEINLLIASGDYPDLINNLQGYYSSGLDSAIEQEVIVNIADFEDLMPNYFAKLRERDALEDATTEGGNIGVVYQVSQSSDSIQSGLTLRQDYLEELGVDAPTTYDELHDLLMQIKETYNVNQPLYVPKSGAPDTFFDGFGTELNYVLNNEMGSAPWSYVDTGDGLEAVFGFMDDSYYDVLELMSTWFADGLFNADYLNNNYNVDVSNLTSGEFACLYATEQTLNAGNTFQEHMWAAYPTVSLDGGKISTADTETSAIAAQGYSITTCCENMELAAQWLDFQYTDEAYILNNYGIEGQSFEYDDQGKPYLTDLIMNNPDGIAQAYTQFIYLSVTGSFYLDNDRFTSNYCEEAKASVEIWKSAYDYYESPYDTSAIQMTVEEQEEYSQIFSDISTYCNQAIAEFITGQVALTQDSFESFRSNLVSMGIEKCAAIYQAAADRYLEELNA